MIFVYKTVNKINGKYYIGVHKGEEDDSYLGSGIALQKAIKKYGRENFERIIIKDFDDEEQAYEFEKKLVTEIVVRNSNTYNMTVGGKGGWYHVDSSGENNPMKNPETVGKITRKAKETRSKNPEKYAEIARKNLSVAQKNQVGRKRTEETKNKISQSNKGRKGANLGKKFSEETKEKMSKSWTDTRREEKSFWMKERIEKDPDIVKTNKGKKFSEETKEKMSKSMRESWKNRQIYTCVHCGLSSKNASNINRWHNDNCKKRKTY